MSKEKDVKTKNNKKTPVLNLKEKRAAKAAKHIYRSGADIPNLVFLVAEMLLFAVYFNSI